MRFRAEMKMFHHTKSRSSAMSCCEDFFSSSKACTLAESSDASDNRVGKKERQDKKLNKKVAIDAEKDLLLLQVKVKPEFVLMGEDTKKTLKNPGVLIPNFLLNVPPVRSSAQFPIHRMTITSD